MRKAREINCEAAVMARLLCPTLVAGAAMEQGRRVATDDFASVLITYFVYNNGEKPSGQKEGKDKT